MNKRAIIQGFLEAVEFDLDESYRDRAVWRGFTKKSQSAVNKIVADFLEKVVSADIDLDLVSEYWKENQLGHDLYFSMIGAGVGLWDRYLDFKGEEREEVQFLGDNLDGLVKAREVYCAPTGNGYLSLEIY